LITVESLRTDHVGCYAPREPSLTPTIDALAARGVRFERAYAASPSTAPSVATALTGLYPVRHGLRDDLGGRIGEGVPTLASLLQEAGYHTGAVVGTSHLDSDRGLDRGFELYDDDFRAPSTVGPVPAAERPGTEVVQIGREFLDAAPDGRPLFLWLDFYDAHYGHLVPRDDPEGKFRDTPYEEEVAFVDTQIDSLDALLRERDLLGRTHILLAGTHGTGLGDHGEIGHGIYLNETTIRVPLIHSRPEAADAPTQAAEGESPAAVEGGETAPEEASSDNEPKGGQNESNGGETIRRVVGVVDLAPTILEIAGVDPPDGLDGRSWLDGASPTDRRYFVEAVQPHSAYGWHPLYAVIDGTRKVVAGERVEAFELSDDRSGSNPAKELPDWATDLAAYGKDLLGALGPNDKKRAELRAAIEELELPWRNSPICLEKQSMPDPRDRVSLNESMFRAMVLFTQGVRGTAGEVAEEVLESDRANFKALELSVIRLIALGLRDDVLAQLEILQCNYPFRGSAYHQLGHVRLNDNDAPAAEGALKMYARLEPWSEQAHYDLTVFYARQGKSDEAFRHLEKAISLGATDFDYIRRDPGLQPLRDDPRFTELVYPAAVKPGAP
jgi:arylsulfatase A-like enzyme